MADAQQLFDVAATIRARELRRFQDCEVTLTVQEENMNSWNFISHILLWLARSSSPAGARFPAPALPMLGWSSVSRPPLL